MGKPIAGRASIFRGKINGVRVQGQLTKRGGAALERKREELARLVLAATGHRPASLSDADVIEYLARGYQETWLELYPG